MAINHKHKTYMPKKEKVQRRWFHFDATGKTLGRFASEVSKVLRGRHRTDFSPHVDNGDGVIITNASKIVVTGNKKAQKLYTRHTGYVGGLRRTVYSDMMEKDPTFALRHAIKGMMPKNALSRKQLTRLRITAAAEHGSDAQQPTTVEI